MRRRALQNLPSHTTNGFAKSQPLLPTATIPAATSRRTRSRARYAARIIFSAGCTLLILWICSLKWGLGREEALRILSSDHANLTQFFPCINDVSSTRYIGIDDVLQNERKKTRQPYYDSLPCAPPLCFRGVYDGFDDLVAHFNRYDKISIRKPQVGTELALLIEAFIMNQKVPSPLDLRGEDSKIQPVILQKSIARQKNFSNLEVERDENYGGLHADYYESNQYVYTAILYGEPSIDLVGGETGFVDWTKAPEGSSDSGTDEMIFGLQLEAANRGNNGARLSNGNTNDNPVELISGVTVEPKRGRLVIFSSGGENFHAPLPVYSGFRPTFHFWFTCQKKRQVEAGTERL